MCFVSDTNNNITFPFPFFVFDLSAGQNLSVPCLPIAAKFFSCSFDLHFLTGKAKSGIPKPKPSVHTFNSLCSGGLQPI